MTDREIAKLQETITKCRRLITGALDARTREALQTYLADLERQLQAEEAPQLGEFPGRK
jgi:hypothetical protein